MAPFVLNDIYFGRKAVKYVLVKQNYNFISVEKKGTINLLRLQGFSIERFLWLVCIIKIIKIER